MHVDRDHEKQTDQKNIFLRWHQSTGRKAYVKLFFVVIQPVWDFTKLIRLINILCKVYEDIWASIFSNWNWNIQWSRAWSAAPTRLKVENWSLGWNATVLDKFVRCGVGLDQKNSNDSEKNAFVACWISDLSASLMSARSILFWAPFFSNQGLQDVPARKSTGWLMDRWFPFQTSGLHAQEL